MTGLSELVTLQASILTSQAGAQWVGVFNDAAGRFQAPEVAAQVAERIGPGMSLYQTSPDPVQRVREITDLIRSRSPSPTRPLGVLAFGGDRTLNDTLLGVLGFIFRDPRDLQGPPEGVADRMLESGIQLGVVRMGGENDNGANYGAPAGDLEEVMAYLDRARVTSLNMGMALLLGDETPQIFCHTLGAGETIATVFEKTQRKRGIWNNRRQKLLFVAHVLRQREITARWEDFQGTRREQSILEVLVHAAVRTAGINGLPGTPQPGLGVKIFPAEGLWRTLRTFREVISRGRASLKGDPSGLGPEARLESVKDDSLQISLAVGDEIDFSFFTADGVPLATAIQSNGDFRGRSQRVTIRALPPFPRFMVMDGSLMAHLVSAIQ